MLVEQDKPSLEISKGITEEQFGPILHSFAERYCNLLGVDFKKEVLPNLGNKDWWEADYGQASRDGKSIGMSAKDALRCLVDTHRTYQIYRGIEETVKVMKESGRTGLTGIDAGTGTGILAIIMIGLGVDKVHAIEVNNETFELTSKFLEQLSLTDKIKLIQGDATQMDIPELTKKGADLLVSENLSGGLFDEPQYDIINHLSNFLSTGAEIIPNQAELFVSLATTDWEGSKPDKNNIAARRLKSYSLHSSRVKYAEVNSKVRMNIPIIESEVVVPTNSSNPINALLISTRFRINSKGQPIYLEPDTADFLGKTSAFKMEGVAIPSNNLIIVRLKYEAGRERKNLKITANGNRIELIDTMLK